MILPPTRIKQKVFLHPRPQLYLISLLPREPRPPKPNSPRSSKEPCAPPASSRGPSARSPPYPARPRPRGVVRFHPSRLRCELHNCTAGRKVLRSQRDEQHPSTALQTPDTSQNVGKMYQMLKMFVNFGPLVLVCIEADFVQPVFVSQHVSIST